MPSHSLDVLARLKDGVSLDAARAEKMARRAATREHAEVAPSIIFNVVGGVPTATMTVHGADGTHTYTARADGRGLTKIN